MTVTSPEPEDGGDVTPIIDLTLYDVTSQDLVELALTDAVTKTPDWVPREGNTEVVLLESQALMEAESIYAINRLPRAFMAELLARYQLPVNPGTPPVVTVRFATSTAGDTVIPAGTRIRVTYAGDSAFLDFLTDTDLLIPGGTFEGTVTATGEEPTAALNGAPPGPAELVDAISMIESVALDSEVTGGVDPEDEDAYLRRGSLLFRRLVSTLVLPEHFTLAALGEPVVARAATFDLYDPTAGTGAPGDHPGHVTVAATGPGGTVLADQVKTDLVAMLEGKAHAALVVHVIDATVTTLPVAATVVLKPGYDPATVTAAVQAAVEGYLDPDVWPFAGSVYRNELIALVDGVTGVSRVVDVTDPTGDVALGGVAPLVRAGAVTVTVTVA